MRDRKLLALAEIADEIRECTRCPLHEGRTHVVPGYGSPNAEILFIGEAPGKNEDEQGMPFVGRSGHYLDDLLAGIGLNRKQVFIANVIKCRPPGNRDPQTDEMLTCNPFLKRQIAAIDPLVIATLGRFSMGLFFPNAKISAIHGQPRYAEGRAYYPFYHPAAALRNPALRDVMEADMARLLDVLAEVKRKRAAGEFEPPEPVDDEAQADEPVEPAEMVAEALPAEPVEDGTPDMPDTDDTPDADDSPDTDDTPPDDSPQQLDMFG